LWTDTAVALTEGITALLACGGVPMGDGPVDAPALARATNSIDAGTACARSPLTGCRVWMLVGQSNDRWAAPDGGVGSVESFDLAVGLGPVGMVLLVPA
jgi:hypothetical protein